MPHPPTQVNVRNAYNVRIRSLCHNGQFNGSFGSRDGCGISTISESLPEPLLSRAPWWSFVVSSSNAVPGTCSKWLEGSRTPSILARQMKRSKKWKREHWMYRHCSLTEAFTFGILFGVASHFEMPCLPQASDELHQGSLYSTESFHMFRIISSTGEQQGRMVWSRNICKRGWKKYAFARLHQNRRHFGNMAAPHIINNSAGLQVVQALYISILSTSLGFICGEELLKIPSPPLLVQNLNMSVNRACKECQRQE